MAQVILTDATRLQLVNDTNFQYLCRAAILDQSLSTLNDNGTSKPDAASAKKWGLWTPLAAQILNNPSMISGNGNLADQFSMFIVQRNLVCWDSSTNLTSDAILWLQGNHGGNVTNYFGANALAQDWFINATSATLWNKF